MTIDARSFVAVQRLGGRATLILRPEVLIGQSAKSPRTKRKYGRLPSPSRHHCRWALSPSESDGVPRVGARGLAHRRYAPLERRAEKNLRPGIGFRQSLGHGRLVARSAIGGGAALGLSADAKAALPARWSVLACEGLQCACAIFLASRRSSISAVLACNSVPR